MVMVDLDPSSAVILLHSFFPSGHAAWWPHLESERERKEEKGAVRWREGAMPTPTAGSGMWERARGAKGWSDSDPCV